MLGNTVKAMYAQGYSVRQCSIIAGCSYDYVLKIIKGERGSRITCSTDDMTDTQIERKKVLDLILSLRGYELVPQEQKYNYFSLLSYLGYSDYHLIALFPHDNVRFIRQAAHYSDKAWQKFDSISIGIPTEAYERLWMPETRHSKREVEIKGRDPHAADRQAAKRALFAERVEKRK